MPRRLLILPVMFLVLCAAKFAPELEVWTGPAINAGTKILDSDSTQLTVAPSLTVIDGTGSEPTWTVLPQIISQRNTSGTHDAAIAILSGAVGGKSILLFSTSASYADGLIQVDPQNDKMEFFLNGAEELEISGATATFSDALVAATIDTGQGAFEINGSLTPSNLIGTANQIVLSGSGVGALANGANVTLSLPQDIATGSAVEFGALVVTSINTGQGVTEVFAMDQAVTNSSSPTFNVLNLTTDLGIAYGGTGASSLEDIVGTANEITVSAGADSIIGGNVTLSLPDDVTVDGLTLNDLTASRLISSNASKVLTSVADLASWVGGTANRVTVTTDGDGTITLSGPQDLASGSSPTFAGLTLTADLTVANGGTGASSLDDIVGTTNEIEVTAGADTVIGGDVTIGLPDAVTVVTLNTGQGANELYDMNQDVQSDDAVTFVTVNTGQGANELYDMNQDVKTTNDVRFSSVSGEADEALSLKGDADVQIQIDADNDGTETFTIHDGAGTEVVSITEAGALQIDGAATLDGNVTLGDATADVTTVSGELDGSRHSWVISESATETNTMYANSYLVVGGITQSSTVGMRAATSGSIVGISINCNVTAANASGSLWVEVNGSGLYGVALPSGTGVGNVGVRQNRGVDTFAAGNIISFRVYNGTFTTYTFNNYTIELEYYYDD